jgi:hypothetical protein
MTLEVIRHTRMRAMKDPRFRDPPRAGGITRRDALAPDDDRINAARPRTCGIRKWEVTSAGGIQLFTAEIIWIGGRAGKK